MRWELLFGDLETQLHAATQQDLEQRINELARVELAQATFAEVLRGSLDRQLSVIMCNGSAFHGEVQRVEHHWMLLGEGSRSALIPLAKILRVQGTGTQRVGVSSKIPYTLQAALRVLARNRSAVVLGLEGNQPATLRGVLDQVGADYLQMMQMADGVGRDRGNTQGIVVVPLAGVVSIASASDNEF
ncbi:hypothetical protein SAMN04489740_0153 [Arthrobacter alpinus]|uniref:Uncharacterized protein n=1 Tax=Arthrobacter alpinus TaxID=656366 RepID=A0A1H5E5E8_9MICC|nr:hypothetical protein [Arthrobacter alpinus]SED86331.1 hypothetical protein SAMN04489740_0153 [Arthrobacter alpinus]